MNYVHDLMDSSPIKVRVTDILETMEKNQIFHGNESTAKELLKLMKLPLTQVTLVKLSNGISQFKKGRVKATKFRQYTIINLRNGKGYFLVDLRKPEAVEYIYAESIIAHKENITRKHNASEKLKISSNQFVELASPDERESRREMLTNQHYDMQAKLLDHESKFNKHMKSCPHCGVKNSNAKKICVNCDKQL